MKLDERFGPPQLLVTLMVLRHQEEIISVVFFYRPEISQTTGHRLNLSNSQSGAAAHNFHINFWVQVSFNVIFENSGNLGKFRENSSNLFFYGHFNHHHYFPSKNLKLLLSLSLEKRCTQAKRFHSSSIIHNSRKSIPGYHFVTK